CPRYDTRANSCLLGDSLEELAAILRFAGRARGDGDNLVHTMGFGQTPEFRQYLERRVHSLRRERPSIESARTEADHLLLAVDDLEGEVRPDLHDDHVDRVRADVDGCNALLRP